MNRKKSPFLSAMALFSLLSTISSQFVVVDMFIPSKYSLMMITKIITTITMIMMKMMIETITIIQINFSSRTLVMLL